MKLLSIAFAFFLAPILACAQVVITEIMYDVEGTDTGREWIEVKNIGTEPIDLTAWKLFEANTNHAISSSGETIVPVGGFAIIVDVPDKFKTDAQSFTGLVFDSAFSLSNTGETFSIKNPSGIEVDAVAYSSSLGAAGNGFSLQKAVSSWIAAPPTTGSETTATQSETPPETSSNGNATTTGDTDDSGNNAPTERTVIVYSSHASQAVANGSYDEPELVVTSGRPRLGYVGVPLAFEAKVKSMKNIPLGNTVGNVWSMGDGAQKSGQFISHTYDFPGEYTVLLNSNTGGASAVSKVKVTIVEPKVELREANGSYIEIINLDGLELNVGGWILETKGRRFVVPQDTIILPRSSLKIPSKNSNIKDIDSYIHLAEPSGRILARRETGRVGPVVQGGQDPVLISGEDISIDALRERIAMASHGALAKARLASEVIRKDTSAVPITVGVSEPDIATSTQSAAVIYTVKDTHEKGWWGKIISIFQE
jgi:hypothetical protein